MNRFHPWLCTLAALNSILQLSCSVKNGIILVRPVFSSSSPPPPPPPPSFALIELVSPSGPFNRSQTQGQCNQLHKVMRSFVRHLRIECDISNKANLPSFCPGEELALLKITRKLLGYQIHQNKNSRSCSPGFFQNFRMYFSHVHN